MTIGDILAKFAAFFSFKPTPKAEPVKEPARGVSHYALNRALGIDDYARPTLRDVYRPMPAPTGAKEMAFDYSAFEQQYAGVLDSFADQGLGFLGYGYLAQLTQRVEYRMPSEVRAEEMTRKWIQLEYAGEEEDGDKIGELNKALEDFKVRDIIRRALEVDGEFGRSQIFIDTGSANNPAELATKLMVDSRKIAKGGLRGFKVIEPLWSYPQEYDSANPLAPDFYIPQVWYVQGKRVHASRLLTIVSKPVPDMLKPAYAFGGVSLTQIAIPYVENFLRTRDSISELIHSFSIMVLMTDMTSILTGGPADDLLSRLEVYTEFRDNRGMFAVDKATEDMKNLAVPLSGLDKLQAQAQEQMATPFREPLVKAFGITPSGLNASDDGEIRVFYDGIHAGQEKLVRDPLTVMTNAIQLHLWGEIDENITFSFVPLWQPTEQEASATRKQDADTDVEYVTNGIIDPLEVRKRLAADKSNPYHGLDVEDVPEPPTRPGDVIDGGNEGGDTDGPQDAS